MVYSGGGVRAIEARSSADHWLQHATAHKISLHEFKDGFFPESWPGIKKEFEGEGIEFAFPTQTLYTINTTESGSNGNPPAKAKETPA